MFILLPLERVSVLFLMPKQFFLTITFLVVVLARIFVVVVFGTVLWYPGHFVLFFQASSGIGEPGGDLNHEFHNSVSNYYYALNICKKLFYLRQNCIIINRSV